MFLTSKNVIAKLIDIVPYFKFVKIRYRGHHQGSSSAEFTTGRRPTFTEGSPAAEITSTFFTQFNQPN